RRAPLPFAAARAVVAQHDELRRLVRRVGHGEKGAHAQALEVAPLQHLELQLELPRELLRFLGEVARGTDVARQVAEGAREVGAASARACSSCALWPSASVTCESDAGSGFFCVFRRSKR